MDYRSLVHDKDEAIYSEIRVIVLDIRGFYVSQAELSPTYSPPYCHRRISKVFFCLFTIGRAVRHHQQESGKGDQSERRGETFHVLKLEGGGGAAEGTDSTILLFWSLGLSMSILSVEPCCMYIWTSLQFCLFFSINWIIVLSLLLYDNTSVLYQHVH